MRKILPLAALLPATLVLMAQAAPEAAPPAPTPVTPVSGDSRDVSVAACLNEAKAQGAKKGVIDVTLREVEDTDKKSDSRGAVRALVNVVIDKDGKQKTVKKTFKCSTQNGIVTAFKYY
ncbi:hypothetical protein [Sphingobium yanoikuyae]|jgi:hypothetical protein|uniref:Uncharacterized protein n=1 Tax=Sphingobium yanoikuyae TaxID=13690 RepID=A0A9X7UFW5_SPHYA|nr:hypothetical protein [Sphingobium yanoikuyae]QNG46642.1 hypothetical protein H3V42_02965 [Sphingobium yanoikuyae]RSU80273.1 hypothetical protein BRX37_01165 [Sphingomonas sp. S-NIH.Pt3_0716]